MNQILTAYYGEFCEPRHRYGKRLTSGSFIDRFAIKLVGRIVLSEWMEMW